MRRELEEALYRDFPEEFQQKDLSSRETNMCWGCTCGDGWEPILRRMCEKIKGKGARFVQIKEKFGTLRVYWDAADPTSKEDWDLIEKAVDEAESESAKTCEFCSATDSAKIRDGSWIRTLCDKCDTDEGREAQRKKQLEDRLSKQKELE